MHAQTVAAPRRRLRRYDDDDGDGGDWRQDRRHGTGGDTLLVSVGGLLGLGTLILFGLRSLAGAMREGAAAGNNIAGAANNIAAFLALNDSATLVLFFGFLLDIGIATSVENLAALFESLMTIRHIPFPLSDA